MTSNPQEAGSPEKHPWIRWRNQGGQFRAYAELRSMGGGRRALIPPGEKRATTDPEIAEKLLHQHMRELSERNKKKALLAIDPGPDLADVAIHYMEELAASNRYDAETLADWEACLSRVVDYFTRWQHASVRHPEPLPRRRSLASIGDSDVYALNEWLRSIPDPQGNQLTDASRRDHLRALSGVFGTAIIEGQLPMHGNPVSWLMSTISRRKRESEWLSVGELALLLESARTFVCEAQAGGSVLEPPCLYELIATFMLTGASRDEITRLQICHLDFESCTINIPDPETGRVDRSVPLHSQLHEILRPYVQRLGRTSGFVFTTASGEAIPRFLILELIAKRAGFEQGQIRTEVFRTSYIIHRLACTDQGSPIDPYTVAREVGYTSPDLVERVRERVQYGRPRMEELAFRPDMIGSHLSARRQVLYSSPAQLNQ